MRLMASVQLGFRLACHYPEVGCSSDRQENSIHGGNKMRISKIVMAAGVPTLIALAAVPVITAAAAPTSTAKVAATKAAPAAAPANAELTDASAEPADTSAEPAETTVESATSQAADPAGGTNSGANFEGDFQGEQ